MKPLILILIIAVIFISQESFSKDSESKKEVFNAEEVKFKLINALLKTDIALPQKKNCDFHTLNYTKSPTVSEWIAWNLSFFKSGKSNSIYFKCDSLDQGSRCDLEFRADFRGESPWLCGFRFKIDKSFREIDLSSLECTGTC